MANSHKCFTSQITEYVQSNQYLNSAYIALDDENCNITDLIREFGPVLLNSLQNYLMTRGIIY